MPESIAKRLVLLSSTLVAVFIVSLSTILYRVDALDVERDLQALILLSKVAAAPSLEELRGGPKTVNNLLMWVTAHHKNIESRRVATREKLLSWLMDDSTGRALLSQADLESHPIAGKEFPIPEPASKAIEFSEMELTNPAADDKTKDFETEYLELGSVTSTIKKLQWMSRPTTVVIAVDVKLPTVDDAVRQSEWTLNSIRLRSKRFTIKLTEKVSQIVQRAQETRDIVVEASTEDRQGPALLDLGLLDNDSVISPLLKELERDTARLHELQLRYGFLNVERAREIAGQEVSEVFASIQILGFRFSPQRLPFAIAVVSVTFLALIAANVEIARSQKIHLHKIVLENPLQLLVQSTLGRIVLWCVLPSVGVGIAGSWGRISGNDKTLLVLIISTLAIGGLWCTLRATFLFRSAQERAS